MWEIEFNPQPSIIMHSSSWWSFCWDFGYDIWVTWLDPRCCQRSFWLLLHTESKNRNPSKIDWFPPPAAVMLCHSQWKEERGEEASPSMGEKKKKFQVLFLMPQVLPVVLHRKSLQVGDTSSLPCGSCGANRCAPFGALWPQWLTGSAPQVTLCVLALRLLLVIPDCTQTQYCSTCGNPCCLLWLRLFKQVD